MGLTVEKVNQIPYRYRPVVVWILRCLQHIYDEP